MLNFLSHTTSTFLIGIMAGESESVVEIQDGLSNLLNRELEIRYYFQSLNLFRV